MTKDRNAKPYDLEDRTLPFAKEVRNFVKRLPGTVANVQGGKQVIRASDSVGANYIEANEALSKKDFLMRIKICRKEAKERRYCKRASSFGRIWTFECRSCVEFGASYFGFTRLPYDRLAWQFCQDPAGLHGQIGR